MGEQKQMQGAAEAVSWALALLKLATTLHPWLQDCRTDGRRFSEMSGGVCEPCGDNARSRDWCLYWFAGNGVQVPVQPVMKTVHELGIGIALGAGRRRRELQS